MVWYVMVWYGMLWYGMVCDVMSCRVSMYAYIELHKYMYTYVITHIIC